MNNEKSQFKIGHIVSQEVRNKISKANKGKRLGAKHTEKTKKKISISHLGNTWGFQKGHKLGLGNKSNSWKGDNVGYAALHDWVKKLFPKTKFCNACKIVPPFDLANKGTYSRNIENWEWLCRRCHMLKDGRIYNNLIRWRKG